jgi:hypothetical protein
MRTADCGLRAAGYVGPYIDERFPLWYNNLSMRKGGIYETETRYTYIVFGIGHGSRRFCRQSGFF